VVNNEVTARTAATKPTAGSKNGSHWPYRAERQLADHDINGTAQSIIPGPFRAMGWLPFPDLIDFC
jgi:hypothetical protein